MRKPGVKGPIGGWQLHGLLQRRYLRTLAPGVIAGGAAFAVELPSLVKLALRLSMTSSDTALAVLGTISCFCLLGLLFGLSLESVFHWVLRAELPLPLYDFSDHARSLRRSAGIHVFTGFSTIVGAAWLLMTLRPTTADTFGSEFASTLVLAVLTCIPVALWHIAVSRLLSRVLDKVGTLRTAALATSVLLLVISWAVTYYFFRGTPQVIRAVLSTEILLLVFALIWLNPKPAFSYLALGLLSIVIGTFAVLLPQGLSNQSRTLLLKSSGAAEDILLEMPLRHDSHAVTLLRDSVAAAARAIGRETTIQRRIDSSSQSTSDVSALRDILWITVDSLRPDRLGCYGSKAGLTPNLDSFAQSSVVFENGFSAAPGTISSLKQAMAGSLEHRIAHFPLEPSHSRIVTPDTPSVASILERRNYHTLQMAGFPFLSQSPFLGAGFSRSMFKGDAGTRLLAEEMFARILRLLRQPESRPSFVWAHVMDVHSWQREATKRELGSTKPYDSSIVLLDAEFGKLFAGLAQTQRGREAIVIVTADHGESLGEQGRYYHGFMAPVTLRIPLIIRFPGIAPRAVPVAVSQLDIAPTILGAAGVGAESFMGKDLRGLLDSTMDATWPGRSLFHEYMLVTSTARVVESGITVFPWQMIYNNRFDTLMLYNLATDPYGEDNLAGRGLPEEGVLIERLRAAYEGQCGKAW